MHYQEKKYSTQRLRDYALWYYFRYYPSNARLLQKLREKGSEEDSISVCKEIEHLTQESEIIKAKIDNYVFRNKNYRYIRQKMREKLFPVEKIEAYLEKYINTWESILDEDFLRRKIEIFIAKGKSRYYIFQKLWETKWDREILEWLLEKYFPNWESENILREYEKLTSTLSQPLPLQGKGADHKKKQKIIQKLLAKWFKYDEIKKVLQ